MLLSRPMIVPLLFCQLPVQSPLPVQSCRPLSRSLPLLLLLQWSHPIFWMPNAVAAGDLAGAIVQGPLNAAQSSLPGEVPCLPPALLSQLFTSPSLTIYSRVSDKLRAKIWNNEYFEFGALLTNPVYESRYQVTLAKSNTGELSQKPNPTSKTSLRYFHIFVGVSTRGYPHEALALTKYGEVVQREVSTGAFTTKIFVS